jgi:DNA (cytosine-5)-methyltransferase 3A
MKVLSLFDGISCGQLALQRAGFAVDAYYASEIDKNAIKVVQQNFPNTIQLGDITKLNTKDLPDIDLLIGGSPCQGFSFIGKQMNFEDPRSKLFFEYVRILKEVKPKWFLLENVKMKKEFAKIISEYIECEPIEINSSLVSAQNRKRLYWTNIPIQPFENKNINFNKYLYRLGHGYCTEDISLHQKYPTLVAQSPATKYRLVINLEEALKAPKEKLRRDLTITRPITPEECEYLQTLPIGYTDGVSKTQRYKTIGNGWTVDIIAHIFKGINA